jgi:hypothetical protein
MRNFTFVFLFALVNTLVYSQQLEFKGMYFIPKDSIDIAPYNASSRSIKGMYNDGDNVYLVFANGIVHIGKNSKVYSYKLDRAGVITSCVWDTTNKRLVIGAQNKLYLCKLDSNSLSIVAEKTCDIDTFTCLDYDSKYNHIYAGTSGGDVFYFYNTARYLLDSLRIDTVEACRIHAIANNNNHQLLVSTQYGCYWYNIKNKELRRFKTYSQAPKINSYYISKNNFGIYSIERGYMGTFERVNPDKDLNNYVTGGHLYHVGMMTGIKDLSLLMGERNNFVVYNWVKVKGQKTFYGMYTFPGINFQYDAANQKIFWNSKFIRFTVYKDKMAVLTENNKLHLFNVVYADAPK